MWDPCTGSSFLLKNRVSFKERYKLAHLLSRKTSYHYPWDYNDIDEEDISNSMHSQKSNPKNDNKSKSENFDDSDYNSDEEERQREIRTKELLQKNEFGTGEKFFPDYMKVNRPSNMKNPINMSELNVGVGSLQMNT